MNHHGQGKTTSRSIAKGRKAARSGPKTVAVCASKLHKSGSTHRKLRPVTKIVVRGSVPRSVIRKAVYDADVVLPPIDLQQALNEG